MGRQLEKRIDRLEEMASSAALGQEGDLNINSILSHHDQMLIFADWLIGKGPRPWWMTTPEIAAEILEQFPEFKQHHPSQAEINGAAVDHHPPYFTTFR